MKYIKIVALFALMQAQLHAMHATHTYKYDPYEVDSYKSDKKTATPTSKTSSVDSYESDDASLANYIKSVSHEFISSNKNGNSNNPGRYIKSTSSTTSPSNKLPKIKMGSSSDSISLTDSDAIPTPRKKNSNKLPKVQRKQSLDIDYNSLKWLQNNGGENFIEAARISPDFVEYQSLIMDRQSPNMEFNDATTIPEINYQPTARITPVEPTAQRSLTASEIKTKTMLENEIAKYKALIEPTQPTAPTSAKPTESGQSPRKRLFLFRSES